jgi:two-component system cell cycle sensor histidine kinase PleC
MGQLISRQRSEAALRAAAMESAMASRTKSQFLANMSHELRTPLNAIIGFGELIEHLPEEKRSAGKPRQYATHISHAGRHLLEIVNDILNISEIESGSFALKLEPQIIRDIAESCVLLVQRRIEQKSQTLVMAIEDNLPLVVADPLRIKQVLINLLSNASKFTPEGGRITIAGARSDDENVAISVSDTGCGMRSEEIEMAMKPFVRVNSAYTRNQEGTGLGLPIAKALVLRHRGTFDVTSEPGAGTTVTFTLPTVARDSAVSSHRGNT